MRHFLGAQIERSGGEKKKLRRFSRLFSWFCSSSSFRTRSHSSSVFMCFFSRFSTIYFLFQFSVSFSDDRDVVRGEGEEGGVGFLQTRSAITNVGLEEKVYEWVVEGGAGSVSPLRHIFCSLEHRQAVIVEGFSSKKNTFFRLSRTNGLDFHKHVNPANHRPPLSTSSSARKHVTKQNNDGLRPGEGWLRKFSIRRSCI